jgi:hypothetical protein
LYQSNFDFLLRNSENLVQISVGLFAMETALARQRECAAGLAQSLHTIGACYWL